MGSRVVRAIMQISRPTTSKKGMTLIEVMIVLVIIAGIMGVAVPTIGSSLKITIGSSARSLGGNLRKAYQASVMTGRVYRMVLDFDKNTFLVEEGPVSFELDSMESREKQKEKRKLSLKPEEESTSEMFRKAEGLNNRPVALDKIGSISFKEIYTEERETPIKSGQAAIHFFPHGVAEQAVIYLTDLSGHEVTIKTEPVGGIAEVFDRRVPYEELIKP
jgi:general secretion pathway protein H